MRLSPRVLRQVREASSAIRACAARELVPHSSPIAAGSLMVWSEKTWHGAFPLQPRSAARLPAEVDTEQQAAPPLPGAEADPYRIDLLFFHCNPAMITEEDYRRTVSDDLLARHGPDFATLMGQRVYANWGRGGPTETLSANRERLQRLGVDST